MIVRTPQYVLDKIEKAVWDGIKTGYDGPDTFGPVYVLEHPDAFDDDRIHVYILYDGKDTWLDLDFRSSVSRRIEDYVTPDEMPFLPRVRFTHKSWQATVERISKWIPKS